LKKFVFKKKSSIFAVQFISGFFVANDLKKRAERHKDILE